MMDFSFTSLTPEQILVFGHPCEAYRTARAARKPPAAAFDWSDSTRALATLREAVTQHENASASTHDPDVEEDTLQVDQLALPITLFRKNTPPEASATAPPLIVLYFGGGFILGSPASTRTLARSLVRRFGAVVVAPGYRLAPEHPFPTGQEDAWAAFAWIAEHARGPEIRACPEQGFVVGGVSSGGNIANVVAHRARDAASREPLTGMWLSCSGVRIAPSCAARLPEKYMVRNRSRQQEEIVADASAEMARLTREALQPDVESRLFAPMVWAADEEGWGHAGFPRTYFQVCGMEPSRDEQLIFRDILVNLGVGTRLDLYAGLPHAFFVTWPELPQAKQWQEDTMEGFAWLLERGG